MTLAAFEARYCDDPDPWGYTASPYEREKYDATLAACGEGPFTSAIELAGSIGVFSERLASRCRSLVTIDGAPTAVGIARPRLAAHSHVRVILGRIPDDLPHRPYDLVVASEILYYLLEAELAGTLSLLEQLMAPAARLVAVHWRPAGPERPFTAAEVHERLRAQPWLRSISRGGTGDYLLDVLERV